VWFFGMMSNVASGCVLMGIFGVGGTLFRRLIPHFYTKSMALQPTRIDCYRKDNCSALILVLIQIWEVKLVALN
jgi:hypothetical protein